MGKQKRKPKPQRADRTARDTNDPREPREPRDLQDGQVPIEETCASGNGASRADLIEASERTVLSLIRDVREGRVSGAMLQRDDRIRVVEHLTGEGYSGAEIAEILKVSERTVMRDRTAVRELNALAPSPEMVGEVVGHMVRAAEQTTARLRRIGRDPNAKPADRIEAEKASWQVTRECVVTLQGLGYLPTAPSFVHAHVSTDAEPPEAESLLAEIERLESLPSLRAADGTPMVSPGLAELRGVLSRSLVAGRLEAMGRDLTMEADIGQSDTGQSDIGQPHTGQSDTGQSDFETDRGGDGASCGGTHR